MFGFEVTVSWYSIGKRWKPIITIIYLAVELRSFAFSMLKQHVVYYRYYRRLRYIYIRVGRIS